MTNPALALRFGPQLAADVLWPVPRNIPLDLTDFLVLNHCLPSTRGDRDTSVQGILQATPGATETSIQRLRDAGALLAANDAQPLYAGSQLWVCHEWYLALLAYLEARSHGLVAPVTSLVAQDGVFPGGLHAGVEVLLAVWQVNGLVTGLYRWQSERLKRVNDAPDRVAVARTSAGQSAASAGALALWISSRTDPSLPTRYVMDLLDLGRLGQRICLAGAELGIGVFLTPAVHDSETCSLLGLADAERRLTYVFGLGVPRHDTSTVDPDRDAAPLGLAKPPTD